MKVFLTVKSTCFLAAGSISQVAGFGPKGRILAFLQCFCCFSSKVQKLAKPIFTDVGCSFFGNPSQKKSHSDWKFIRFSDFQKKRACLQSPSYSGGGWGRAPRDTKKAQSLHFYSVFLSCTKSEKGLHLRLSRSQVGNFLEPQVPRRGTLPAFLQCFLILTSRKPAFLQGFGALGHLQRATRDPKREKKTQFYLHFCRVLVSRVKRWKGDGPRENWKNGTWEPGIWDFGES